MKYLTVAGLAGLLLIGASAALAEDTGLKVMLLYDMEGMSAATDHRYTAHVFEDAYAQGREMVTADVNAAIRGLIAGGATEIIVVDGHGSGNRNGPDVIVEDLLPPAEMHFRHTRFDIYMDSYDPTFDAIVAVGMHAAAGNPGGFLAHTYTAEDIEYTVNGVPFNESMLLAAGAARLGIPLVMVSGDDQLGREIAQHMPWVRYATVKIAHGLGEAESLPPGEAARRIERAARDAVRNLDEARLPEWPGPYRFYLAFQDEVQARAGAIVTGAELVRGRGVELLANDFEDGYRRSTRSIGMASEAGWIAATMAVIAEQPNAEELMRAITARWYQRWIDPQSLLSDQEREEQRRYWGAR